MGNITRVALWLRVSDPRNSTLENQRAGLEALAKARGWNIVKVYEVEESAWRGAHLKAMSGVYEDAHLGQFQVLLVWALDRLSRQGVAATLQIIQRLATYNVQVVSLQESWTDVDGPLREFLLSVVAWVANMESNRHSERTRAGMARAKEQGKSVGRPPGSTDTKKRKRGKRSAKKGS